MNLQKTLLLLSFLSCTLNMSADVLIDDPINTEKDNTNGPRTSGSSVEISASGDELTVDINRYLGNAQVTVIAQDGSSTSCNTYYINGHTSFTIDFTGYATGSYSIAIALQNGNIYFGTFTIV